MYSFLEICADCRPLTLIDWIEWEKTAKNLPELIQKGRLRELIQRLPEVNISELVSDIGAIKRVYVVFTFIAHGYIRGNGNDTTDTCLESLPRKIASIWVEAGRILGVPPVATYAATVLFNFKYQNGLADAEDFEIQFTFTGTEDEKWFYAVSAAIDIQSKRIIEIADKLLCDSPDYNGIGLELTEIIQSLTKTLNKMYERCRPEVFHGQVRKYLSGWFNDPQLPKGLNYELDSDDVFMKLAGGSAAQNPTIQLLDLLLGVKHTAEDPDSLILSGYNSGCPRMNYLSAMRTYMPTEHRQYLDDLESKQPEFISEFKKAKGYEQCVKALVDFRSEHIKMVTRYVICQNSSTEARGTGGSNPIAFLKKCRRETEQCINNK